VPPALRYGRDVENALPGVPEARSWHVTIEEGLRLAVHDFGGDGPLVLLAHATGFHGMVLAPLAEALLPDFHPISFDERGHGTSDPPRHADLEGFAWQGFARDVLGVLDAIAEVTGTDPALRPVGLGHSCGGAALLMAEQARPGTFAGIAAYEPVIFPGDPPLAASYGNNPLSAGALRRRSSFPSEAAAYENFASKAPFNRLAPQALAAYVRYGFARGDDGTLTLRCRPENEAAVYANGFSHDTYAHLSDVSCPVALSCGSETDAFGPDFLELFAARLRDATLDVLPGLSHFGPLEDPKAVAAWFRKRCSGF